MSSQRVARPSARLLRDPAVFFASGAGIGWLSRFPGTLGSLLAFPLALLVEPEGSSVYWLFVAVFVAVGIPLTGRAAVRIGIADAPWIVWDEIAGQLIALGRDPPQPAALAACVYFVSLLRYPETRPHPLDRPSWPGWSGDHGG